MTGHLTKRIARLEGERPNLGRPAVFWFGDGLTAARAAWGEFRRQDNESEDEFRMRVYRARPTSPQIEHAPIGEAEAIMAGFLPSFSKACAEGTETTDEMLCEAVEYLDGVLERARCPESPPIP